jgi:hypothetical protein
VSIHSLYTSTAVRAGGVTFLGTKGSAAPIATASIDGNTPASSCDKIDKPRESIEFHERTPMGWQRLINTWFLRRAGLLALAVGALGMSLKVGRCRELSGTCRHDGSSDYRKRQRWANVKDGSLGATTSVRGTYKPDWEEGRAILNNYCRSTGDFQREPVFPFFA